MSQPERAALPAPAARTRDIAPFHVMEVLARVAALEARGRHVVHMEIGEPDFPTPEPVLAAARRTLEGGRIRYTPALGIAELRAAIADFYHEHHGVSVSPERVIVTPGASGALQLAMAALVDPGRSVLLADPGYPCNRHFVRLFEGEPVSVPVGPAQHYQLTPELARRHARADTVALMLGTPSNPTGTVVGPAALEAMVDCAASLGVRLVVDEIYQGLVYAGEARSALAFTDEAFVVNSFSKYFGMTGWRLGWLVAPRAFVRELEKLAQNLFLAPSTVAQHAALAAFEPATLEVLEERRRAFQERRDYLLPALRELGFDVPVAPEGAFYIYARCERFTGDSQAFALDLLERAEVAITPGLDFGEHGARRHVRFAYTTALGELEEGVERLRRYLAAS